MLIHVQKIILTVLLILSYFLAFSQHNDSKNQEVNSFGILSKENSDSSIYIQAYTFIKELKIKEANQLVSQLQKTNPNYKELYFLKGLIFALKGKYAHAISNFNTVLENNPKHEKALYNRALAKALLDDYKSAIEDLNKCIAINPNYTLAYYSRGYWNEIMRNFNEAISDYQKTIVLYKYFNEAYLALAYVYYQTGDKINACETLKKATSEGMSAASDLFQNYCQ